MKNSEELCTPYRALPDRLHLLLADDDADDLDFFRDALHTIPVPVQLTTVNDGAQLMKWLTQTTIPLPDYIFLDLNMPRKNGLQCLTEIKANPALKALPVIILSTASNPAEIDQLYQIGAQFYIQKPNDFGQLIQTIDRFLKMPEEKKVIQPAKEDFIFTPNLKADN